MMLIMIMLLMLTNTYSLSVDGVNCINACDAADADTDDADADHDNGAGYGGHVQPQCGRGELQREEPQQGQDQVARSGNSCQQDFQDFFLMNLNLDSNFELEQDQGARWGNSCQQDFQDFWNEF